jgi:hypothetical protein
VGAAGLNGLCLRLYFRGMMLAGKDVSTIAKTGLQVWQSKA